MAILDQLISVVFVFRVFFFFPFFFFVTREVLSYGQESLFFSFLFLFLTCIVYQRG